MSNPDSIRQKEEHEVLEHWSLYGQRGAQQDHRVTSSEWQRQPFIAPVTSPWGLKLEPSQIPPLLLGFVPNTVIAPLEHIVVGEVICNHGFMSLSSNENVNASEDKWFIYADGPDGRGEVRVHMHRSWTGNKQMELVIDAGYEGYGVGGGGASIVSIIWESDERKGMRGMSPEEYKKVTREVCSWVLGVSLAPGDSQSRKDSDYRGSSAAGPVPPGSSTAAANTANITTTPSSTPPAHRIPRRPVPTQTQPQPEPQPPLLEASMQNLSVSSDSSTSAQSHDPARRPDTQPPRSILTPEEVKFVRECKSSGKPMDHVDVLITAASRGYVGVLKSFVADGLSINGTDTRGQTALHAAVECNELYAVRYLLSAGVDANSADKQRATPLLTAVTSNNIVAAALLMGHPDTDPNKADVMGWTPLAHAALRGNEQMVATLIRGCRVSKEMDSPRSPLFWAKANGYQRIVGMLQAASASEIHPSIGRRKLLELGAPYIFDLDISAQPPSDGLAIPIEIHGHFIRARVTTGTETCVCGASLAKKLQLDRLIDKRWEGKMRGWAGASGKVTGRVHSVDIRLAGQYISHSLAVVDSDLFDFILGLNFLKKLNGKLDLGSNLFITDNIVIPEEFRSIPMYDLVK